MESKKIAFYTCSNGYGHFSRVLDIASYLVKDHRVTIYCEKSQLNKFKPKLKAKFVTYKIPNIRWDLSVNNLDVRFKQYLDWVDLYGPTSLKYDIVISDNIVGLLKFRKDTILTGSFLWRDVYLDKFGDNELSKFDSFFLDLYNPILCTNKYVETGTAKTYLNRFRTGFGFEIQKSESWLVDTVVSISPSLKYNNKYLSFQENFLNLIKSKTELNTSTSLDIVDKCVYIIRPGVGMITHCVKNRIPMIALYADTDSTEIMELAAMVEELGIGIKHNIKLPFNIDKLNVLLDNTIYNNISFETKGYSNISKFILK